MTAEHRASERHRDAGVWWALGWALLVTALAFEWSRRYGHNVCDDALISLQYARNASEGLGFVFNPGERVEGFTNFLWTAFLALAHPMSDGTSAGFVRLAATMSIALAAVDILLLYRLGRLIWPRRLAPIVLALGLCALDNGYTVWAMQALESHLLIFTMLTGCLFLWRKPSRWNGVGAALSLSAAMMTRPDAALLVAVLGASELLWAWRSPEPKRALLRVIAIFGATALVFGAYFLWRYEYFGYLFPNTYYVKASGLRDEAIARGWRYLNEFLSDRAYVPVLALGAVAGIRDRVIGPLFAWALLYTAYVVYVGGDFYPGHRFFVVLIPIAALLSAYTLERAACWTRARWSSTPRAAWGVWTLGFAFVATVAVRGLLVGPVQTEVIRWGGEFARVRAFMEWLGEQAPPDASIVTGDIGSSGFYANLYVYDYFGIIDPITAHQEQDRLGRGKAGHEKHADPDYLLSKGPTYIKRGYIHRDLYRHGYYFDSDIPARLNEPGIWRKDDLAEQDGWALQSRIPFEAQPYADWSATGEAFQRWPVRRASRGQQQVVGQVDWFVSSYHPTQGDAAVGRLRSAPFPLEGDVLIFRIAGGRDPKSLRAELLVDGEVIASATGHNSEIFARRVWSIADHRGRSATLQIVDDAMGGWGHIMVDEIEQWTARAPSVRDIK
jgi:arabinofuranosyltransferase